MREEKPCKAHRIKLPAKHTVKIPQTRKWHEVDNQSPNADETSYKIWMDSTTNVTVFLAMQYQRQEVILNVIPQPFKLQSSEECSSSIRSFLALKGEQ